jgi:hypothetical protein
VAAETLKLASVRSPLIQSIYINEAGTRLPKSQRLRKSCPRASPHNRLRNMAGCCKKARIRVTCSTSS